MTNPFKTLLFSLLLCLVGLATAQSLSPEAIAESEAKIKTLAFSDEAVLAYVGDPDYWKYEIHYDEASSSWSMQLWRAIDYLTLTFYQRDNGAFVIDKMFDPKALDEHTQLRLKQDQAIELAYEAPELDEAITGVSSWVTYAEPQMGNTWTVEFAADGLSLITVLVDINSWQVLQTEVPNN